MTASFIYTFYAFSERKEGSFKVSLDLFPFLIQQKLCRLFLVIQDVPWVWMVKIYIADIKFAILWPKRSVAMVLIILIRVKRKLKVECLDYSYVDIVFDCYVWNYRRLVLIQDCVKEKCYSKMEGIYVYYVYITLK